VAHITAVKIAEVLDPSISLSKRINLIFKEVAVNVFAESRGDAPLHNHAFDLASSGMDKSEKLCFLTHHGPGFGF